MKIPQLVEQYAQIRPQLNQSLLKIQDELTELLEKAGLRTHGLMGRVKTISSFERKLSRPDRIYHKLDDMTDLIGLRVITYFAEDVDDVAQMIEDHYDIDLTQSVDKRLSTDPNAFGYQSLHYICKLDGHNHGSFEVQIRSILQHAWAEIEHDLGYKSSISVPVAMRRRFSRLAGVLELADEEFCTIRQEKLAYRKHIKEQSYDRLLELKLDTMTVETLVHDPLVCESDQYLAELFDLKLSTDIFFPDYLAKLLQIAGIDSIQDARKKLEEYHGDLVNFAQCYASFARQVWSFSLSRLPAFSQGYSLFFLAHLTAYMSEELSIKKVNVMKEFYMKADYHDNMQEADRIAQIFVDTMKREYNPKERS